MTPMLTLLVALSLTAPPQKAPVYTPSVRKTELGSKRWRTSSDIQALAISQDGNRVAVGHDDGVIVFDSKGQAVFERPTSSQVSAVRFFLTGDRLTLVYVSGITVNRQAISHRRRPSPPITLAAGDWSLEGTTISPNGRFVAAVYWEGALVNDALTGRIVAKLPKGTRYATFSGNGARLAVHSDSSANVGIYNTQTWKLLGTHARLGKDMHGLALSHDGRYVATELDERTLIWKSDTGQHFKSLKLEAEVLHFTPNNWLFGASSIHYDGRVINPFDGEPRANLANSALAPIKVAAASRARVATSGGTDRTVALWNLKDGTPVAPAAGTHGAVSVLAVSPTGQQLAVVGEFSGPVPTVLIHDIDSGKFVDRLESCVVIPAKTWHPRGDEWDLGPCDSGGSGMTRDGQPDDDEVWRNGANLTSLGWRADGVLVGVAENRVMDVRTWRLIASLGGEPRVSPDGEHVVSASKTGLSVLDTRSGAKRSSAATGLDGTPEFSPDGSVVALMGENQRVQVFELETGKLRPGGWEKPLPGANISLVFHGSALSVFADDKLHRYDVASGRTLGNWRLPMYVDLAAVASQGKQLLVWDDNNGGRLTALTLDDAGVSIVANHRLGTGEVTALATNPVGDLVFVGWSDSTVSVVDLTKRSSAKQRSGERSKTLERARRKACVKGATAECAHIAMTHRAKREDINAAYFFSRACTGTPVQPLACIRRLEYDAKGKRQRFPTLQGAKAFCKRNYATACVTLADRYDDGDGVPYDDARAVMLFERGCVLGSGRGCHVAGYMRRYGEGVDKDIGKAAALYETGCKLGYASSCSVFAKMLRRGIGVKRDPTRASELDAKACQKESATSCFRLGYLADNGKLSQVGRAIGLYEKACGLEHGTACYNLALLHLKGRGVTKSLDKAVELYKDACIYDESDGCFRAGLAYQSGRGIKKSAADAFHHFVWACKQDHVGACAKLVAIYRKGNGTDKNLSLSTLMRDKACRLGHKKSCPKTKKRPKD